MAGRSIKRHTSHDGITDGNRCPAGSHIIRATAPSTNMDDAAAASKTSFQSFSSTNLTQTSDRRNDHQGHLSDLAFAAEQARIEARKNHKRYTDAIYARRRRLREKEDEKELVRESEHVQQVNKKLREENNQLQSMLAKATAEIEAMDDADKEWLRGVLDKAILPSEPTPDTTEVSEIVNKKHTAKRPSRRIESTSKSNAASPEATTILHSPNGTSSDNGSTRIEDTATTSTTARPLSASAGSSEAHSVETNHRRHDDGNNAPHRTGDRSIEALRQESYLQGLQDAVLLNQRREALAAASQIYQQHRPPPPVPVAAAASVAVDALTTADTVQSALMNDPIRQRTLDQLLLLSRINEMTGQSDSNNMRPDMTSLLDRTSLFGSFNPVADLLSRNTSILGQPPDSSILAALAGLINIHVPPVASPTLPASLTAAQIMAMNNITNPYLRQLQSGLLSTPTDRTNILTLLLQHQQQQEQQLALLSQLQQQQQQHTPSTSHSSPSRTRPPGDQPHSNFPP